MPDVTDIYPKIENIPKAVHTSKIQLAKITIKTSYSKYDKCESTGVDLIIDGDILINPPVNNDIEDNNEIPENNDSNNSSNTNKKFIVDFTEDRDMTKAKFEEIRNSLMDYIIITDIPSNNIINDMCFVNYNCSDSTCSEDNYTATLTIKCDSYNETKNITLNIGS